LVRTNGLKHRQQRGNGRTGVCGHQQISKAGRVPERQNVRDAGLHAHRFVLGTAETTPVYHVNLDEFRSAH